MGVRVEVTSTTRIGNPVDEILSNTVDGLNLAAERGLTLTSARVPLDLGTLLGSGQVERATDPEEGAAIMYDTPYAARLHEHPEFTFQNGRQGKYVEDPIIEHRKELGDIIRTQVRGGS